MRPCLGLGLPEDHVTLLDCHWKEHPQSLKTQDLILQVKSYPIPIYGVTGASGAGKDTFVEGSSNPVHIRFGDVMKDWAYEFGMVPHDRTYYENNREARYDKLPCGRTPLDAWISLDVIRTYNPFVFVERSLENLLHSLELYSDGTLQSKSIVFSGMRTELGLDVVRELVMRMYRVERPGHIPPSGATLDELQVIYPVDEVIQNESTEADLKYKGSWFLQ